jgi:hypothetical protein
VIAPIFPLRQADPALAAKKKRVLLVDSSRATRDLRSETMRRLGAEVDCAADISEARCWWRPDLYNLVLMNIPSSMVQTQKFCDDIRRFMPQQQIMFLVGKPDYLLAVVPGVEQSASGSGDEHDVAAMHEGNAKLEGKGLSQRWGILEACRRISAVRSKMHARLRAMRDLPGPKRDPDTSRPQRKNEVESLLAIPEPMEESQ